MALYRREKPLALKASISALYNNLSAHVNLNKSKKTKCISLLLGSGVTISKSVPKIFFSHFYEV